MATYGPERFTTKSGKVVIFRHCEPSDVGAFLEFQPKIAAETTNTLQVIGKVPDQEKIREAWISDSKSSVSLRLGCFLDSKMIGQLSFFPERQPPHPWTEHIGRFGMFVLQEFWGDGVGRKLLEIMENHARTVGITRIEAGWLPPRLETERLVLRPLAVSDAPAIFEYAKNPNVSRYTLWEPHANLKDSESYILDYAIPYYSKKTPEPLGITLKSNPNKVIGTVGCFWVSKSALSMELAYAIAEPYWGKGFVAEAAKSIVDHCFKEYGLVRMQARCKVENTASSRVMEKIGMKFEGTLRSAIFHRGRHWDMHYYAVLRHD